MSTNPKYIVTKLAGVPHAVRIETLAQQSPLNDKSYPIVMQATTFAALELMHSFLIGLSLNASWTSRESRVFVFLKEGMLPDGRTELALNRATNSKRLAPNAWFSLLAGVPKDTLLELSVQYEPLAYKLFDALLDGSLTVRFAEPTPG